MLTVILGLIGALLGVSGGFIYQYLRNKATQALLDNNKVKTQLNAIDQTIAQNNGTEAALEAQRAQAQQTLQSQEGQLQSGQTKEQLLTFLNTPTSKSNSSN
jgi:hypothetical protein